MSNNQSRSNEEDFADHSHIFDERDSNAFELNKEEYVDFNSEAEGKQLQKIKSKIKLKKYLIFLALTLTAFAFLFFIVKISLDSSKLKTNIDSTATKVEKSQKTSQPTSTPNIINISTNPIIALWPEAPKVISVSKTIKSSQNSFAISYQNFTDTFTAPEQITSIPAQQCSLNLSTDFCLLGESLNANYYYFNDLAHSKFLESSSGFTQEKISAFKISGYSKITLAGNQVDTLALVNKDSSGILIVFKNTLDQSQIESFTKQISFVSEGINK